MSDLTAQDRAWINHLVTTQCQIIYTDEFEDEMKKLISFEFGKALLKKFVADCRKMAIRNWSKSDVEALNKLFIAVLSQLEYDEVESE